MRRIIIISELYFPEDTSTGYFITGIAEGLSARGRNVEVVAAQPTYSNRGEPQPVKDIIKGVKITRLGFLPFDQRTTVGKMLNTFFISLGLAIKGFFTISSGDVVLTVTNPILAPYLIRIICFIKRAHFCLLIHDVYPDVLVPLNIIRKRSILFRIIDFISSRLYKSSQGIITIGRDMKCVVSAKLSEESREKIVVIPNWGDTEEIRPGASNNSKFPTNGVGNGGEFTVLYSGNHGKTHNLAHWAEVGENLKGTCMQFLFVGDGSAKASFMKDIEARSLENFTFHDFVRREELSDLLAAGDLAIISFLPGMEGISVPSRLYNLMASGKPILGVCGVASELAQVIVENDAGWVIDPGDPKATARLLMEIAACHGERERKGTNARRAALEKFSRTAIIKEYVRYFERFV